MSLVIKIRNITRDFPLGNEVVKVLKGIDLDIERGEYVALMGPSANAMPVYVNRASILTVAALPVFMDKSLKGLDGEGTEELMTTSVKLAPACCMPGNIYLYLSYCYRYFFLPVTVLF